MNGAVGMAGGASMPSALSNSGDSDFDTASTVAFCCTPKQ
jgi:hypothetical protein